MNLQSESFQITLQQASSLLQQGQLNQSESICYEILSQDPQNIEALHLLGVIRLLQHQYVQASEMFQSVININPQFSEAYCNLGIALERQNHSDEAIVKFQNALRIDSNNAQAHYNLGLTLQNRNRFDEAITSYKQALAIKSDYVEAYNNLGLILKNLQRFDEAYTCYSNALIINPQRADIHFNLGFVLENLQRYDEAINCYGKALSINADYIEVYNSLGALLTKLKRYPEAINCYQQALHIQPHYAQAHNNLGILLAKLERYSEAITSYQRALQINPDYAQAYYNLGSVLQKTLQFEQANACYHKALAIRPNYAEVYNNLGNVAHSLNQFEAALNYFHKALAINPNYGDATWNESLILLTLGNFALGWQKYQARFYRTQNPIDSRNFKAPCWTGKENLSHKTILLHAEQGLGDTIQFVRYTSLVANMNATVYLEVPEPLLTLLSTVAGIKQIIKKNDAVPSFDFHCPLMSLPLAFNTELSNIPATVPYLTAPAPRIQFWGSQLKKISGYKIGLVWSGNPQHTNDHNRSLPFENLIPLFKNSKCSFISLQKDPPAAVTELMGSYKNIIDLSSELTDFAETAAVISHLDLVIAVDTAVAHLAGALAKPIWLLLPFSPEWRWLMSRQDSPWYPSMKIFRQSKLADWSSVIVQVQQQLTLLGIDNEH